MASPSCACTVSAPPPYSISARVLDIVPAFLFVAASLVFLVMAIQHLGKGVYRRLWLFPCYPVKFLAIKAGTLALLGVAAKSPKLLGSGHDLFPDQFELVGSALVCSFMGACMPSLATADPSDMWSNVAGAGLLLITIVLHIFYGIYKGRCPDDSGELDYGLVVGVIPRMIVAFCMVAFLLVLLTQAIAFEAMMADVGAFVSLQLQKLQMEMRPEHVVTKKAWSWETLEHNTHVKLMMVLTSNPQNVAARSPSLAIVGALTVSSIIIPVVWLGLGANLIIFQTLAILVFGFICVWRWLRVALHDDRSVGSLLFQAQPSYWCRKVNNFLLKLKAGPLRQGQPSIWEHLKFGCKALLYKIAALILLCSIVPIHWVLVVCIRLTYIVSTMLIRISIWLPIRALILCMKWIRRSSMKVASTETEYALGAGVVCLEGENPCTVQQEFEGVAKLIIRRQIKKAETKTNMKALETLLSLSDHACRSNNSVVLDVLDQRGAPSVVLDVEHGHQYGWNLTAISLLAVMSKIEVEALGTYETSKTAMEAYKQALEMVKVVDEMYPPIICSKETYVNAAASVWGKLPKSSKGRSLWKETSRLASPMDILEALLESAKNQIKESQNAPWPADAVVSYTMYTVCRNLQRRWTDTEGAAMGSHSGNAEPMVKHLNYLVAEVLAGCLLNLPGTLDMTMTEAVRKGRVDKVETGILLIHQGQQLWKKLGWPALHGPTNTLGQLNQWLQMSATDILERSNFWRGHSWPRHNSWNKSL
eukprot:c25351_g1_i3 orf=48-2327(+)